MTKNYYFLRLHFASFPFFRHTKTKQRQIHRHILKFNKQVKETFHVLFTLHTLWARRRRKSTVQTRPPSYWEKHQKGFAGMSPMTTPNFKSNSQRKYNSLVKQTHYFNVSHTWHLNISEKIWICTIWKINFYVLDYFRKLISELIKKGNHFM